MYVCVFFVKYVFSLFNVAVVYFVPGVYFFRCFDPLLLWCFIISFVRTFLFWCLGVVVVLFCFFACFAPLSKSIQNSDDFRLVLSEGSINGVLTHLDRCPVFRSACCGVRSAKR